MFRLTDIPTEVFMMVAAYLPPKDCYSLALTCVEASILLARLLKKKRLQHLYGSITIKTYQSMNHEKHAPFRYCGLCLASHLLENPDAAHHIHHLDLSQANQWVHWVRDAGMDHGLRPIGDQVKVILDEANKSPLLNNHGDLYNEAPFWEFADQINMSSEKVDAIYAMLLTLLSGLRSLVWCEPDNVNGSRWALRVIRNLIRAYSADEKVPNKPLTMLQEITVTGTLPQNWISELAQLPMISTFRLCRVAYSPEATSGQVRPLFMDIPGDGAVGDSSRALADSRTKKKKLRSLTSLEFIDCVLSHHIQSKFISETAGLHRFVYTVKDGIPGHGEFRPKTIMKLLAEHTMGSLEELEIVTSTFLQHAWNEFIQEVNSTLWEAREAYEKRDGTSNHSEWNVCRALALYLKSQEQPSEHCVDCRPAEDHDSLPQIYTGGTMSRISLALFKHLKSIVCPIVMFGHYLLVDTIASDRSGFAPAFAVVASGAEMASSLPSCLRDLKLVYVEADRDWRALWQLITCLGGGAFPDFERLTISSQEGQKFSLNSVRAMDRLAKSNGLRLVWEIVPDDVVRNDEVITYW